MAITTSDGKVVVDLVIDSTGAVRGIKTADGAVSRFEATSKRTTGRIGAAWKQMGLAIGGATAAVMALRSGFRLLSESVRLAGIQQIAERKLAQALRNTGDEAARALPRLKEVARELQGISNFGDEAIITAQALLLSFKEVGGAEGAELLSHNLVDTAAGLSKVTGEAVDLNTVAQALGRAMTQGAGALSRYGVSMSEVEKEAFNAAEGMDKVRLLSEILDNNFKGLAEASADPFVQMTNAVNDAKEILGTELRRELAGFATDLKNLVQQDDFREWVRGLSRDIANLVGFIGDAVRGLTAFERAMNNLTGVGPNRGISVDPNGLAGRLGRLMSGQNPFGTQTPQGTIRPGGQGIPGGGVFLPRDANGNPLGMGARPSGGFTPSFVPSTGPIGGGGGGTTEDQIKEIETALDRAIQKAIEFKEQLEAISKGEIISDNQSMEPIDAARASIQGMIDDVHTVDEAIQLMGMNAGVSFTEMAKTAQFALNTVSTVMGQAAESSRTFFEVNKAIAIAQAIIDTYAAANAAYKALSGIPFVGPALGAAAAGTIIAAGLHNVNQMRQQSFSGGGGVSASGGSVGSSISGSTSGFFQAQGQGGFTVVDNSRTVIEGQHISRLVREIRREEDYQRRVT